MLGAIAGDIIGSVYEARGRQIKTENFPLFSPQSHFTDDTVMTIAIADVILHQGDYAGTIHAYGRQYFHAGYGHAFRAWLQQEDLPPYNSWGNGSAMRVSPVGWAFDDLDTVLAQAERSATVTHNHPEGIKGAQAVAMAIYLARKGSSKDKIHALLQSRFSYDLDHSLDEIRPDYRFDSSCQGSVPQSIIAFLEASSVEDAIRKAISLGGDSDTMACIAGAIAEAYYQEIPAWIIQEVNNRIPHAFQEIIHIFSTRYFVSSRG